MSELILQAHGSGGLLYKKLVEEVIKPALASRLLDTDNDSVLLPQVQGKLLMTTDSFVIKPLFFPGGDIGRLAVCGTVNDLAVAGAKPLYLTSSFIIEAGFPTEDLRKICQSMSLAAAEAGVQIVTGDTKVVPQGACDGIYINTAGLGEQIINEAEPPQAGDVIIISGNIGEHEATIAAARDSSIKHSGLQSDVAPLNHISELLYNNLPVIAMRDPTRGGVAAVLNEFAEKFGIGICLDEAALPMSKQAAAIADLYGFEPLYMANEGKFISIIPKQYAAKALSLIKTKAPEAGIIGEVFDAAKPVLLLKTQAGGRRIISSPMGELLPRIC